MENNPKFLGFLPRDKGDEKTDLSERRGGLRLLEVTNGEEKRSRNSF